MRIKVDLESDALYFRLSEDKIEESEEVAKGVIVDYNKQVRFLGLRYLTGKSSIIESTRIESGRCPPNNFRICIASYAFGTLYLPTNLFPPVSWGIRGVFGTLYLNLGTNMNK